MSPTIIASLIFGLQAAPVQPARSQPTAPATAQPTSPAPAPTPAAAPPSLPPDPNTAPDPFTAPDPAPAPAPVAPAPAADGIYYMADAEPTPSGPPAATVADIDQLKYRRLVFSNFYTLNFGLFPIPSGDVSVFLGTNLRPRKSSLGTDWNTAIGYQTTLSLGYADYATSSNSNAIQNRLCPDDEFCFRDAIFFHRHSLIAQGYGGRRSRLYYALGGGAIMWRSLLVGIEAEGKIGYIFTKRQDSRVKGVLGGQLRLGGAFDGFPLPQFGFFLGFMVF